MAYIIAKMTGISKWGKWEASDYLLRKLIASLTFLTLRSFPVMVKSPKPGLGTALIQVSAAMNTCDISKLKKR